MFDDEDNPWELSLGGLGKYSKGSNPLSNTSSGGLGGLFKDSGLGFNIGTAQLGLGALGALGSLFGPSSKLAKKQYKLQQDFANRNFANQTKTYNTTLEDRQRARAVSTGASEAEIQEYLKKNRL